MGVFDFGGNQRRRKEKEWNLTADVWFSEENKIDGQHMFSILVWSFHLFSLNPQNNETGAWN